MNNYTFKNILGRTGHPDRLVAARPADRQFAAARANPDFLVEQAAPDAGDCLT